MSEVKPLYELLQLELGKKNIEKTELPNCITGNLNPAFPMRLYQQKAFQFFLSYCKSDLTANRARITSCCSTWQQEAARR